MGGKFCAWWWWCGVLWTCSLVVGWLQAETIHFTNSPKLIMASKNFTTYEIEVPGSKPITIIEATDPYDRGSSNTHRLDTFPKEVQLPGGPTTSFRTSTGISVSRPTQDGEESSSSSVEHSAGSRKTLYSPELLNKFLKEYSEKLRNADSATRKRLNEITMINSNINRNQNELVPGGADSTSMSADENQYRNKHHPHLDAIQAESQSNTDTNDEPKTEDEFVFNDTHERHVSATNSNKRWYQEPPGLAGGSYQAQASHPQSGHKNHPWNIKDGWVTLEAVPWSESKVSKWHATGSVSELNKNSPGKVTTMQLDKYWNTDSEETPKYKPVATSGSIGASSYYHGEADDDYGYGSPVNRLPSSSIVTPTESFYNRRHPTATLYSERPDADRNRPPSASSSSQPQHLDSWYDQQQQQQLHASNPYDSMKAYHEHQGSAYPTPSTPNRDIITDGRPANFPKFSQDRPGQQQQQGYGADNTPQSQRVRPVSYPDRGNGEWVLISTTKGYQYPKRRHGQRAITFSPATSTSHQTVKLTVLPMKNAIDMTTSHNGLIEVSSSTQTVEDAVKQQKSKRKGQTHPGTTPTISLVGHKKKKHSSGGSSASSQTFSLMRRDATQDSSAVLAAVSAGMVPATMAILAPMVLGRKKK
ncbi:uncharacterized protein LOC126557380 [Anopheles maculipalpis]|uniref:uncharacterized protein LOC126557380 n=1 Tax=Anopheles maculipalpis TaxID=1496333 RepID=UPI002158FF0D|nr:uncharacterized protein LOC126557380 [Anopheles maculipalpis]